MWLHPATIANVNTLRSRGVLVIEPDSGRLTGNDTGVGRLPEPEEIVGKALAFYSSGLDLAGYKFLVLTGGTREPIDAVRFIGNSSSGKQGLALAREAANRGAEVTLVAINIELPIPNVSAVRLAKTTNDVQRLLGELAPTADVILMPAAISDYSVVNTTHDKIHRADQPNLGLELVANPDLISGLVQEKNASSRKQVIVGFAAEVPKDSEQESLRELAIQKMERKGVDVLVANDVSNGQTFSSENNQVLIMGKGTEVVEYNGSKAQVAKAILDYIKPLLAI
jgi:phosphopantothenoylcysteine decarboxylase/phosphopantothenate--cysteine ligase